MHKGNIGWVVERAIRQVACTARKTSKKARHCGKGFEGREA